MRLLFTLLCFLVFFNPIFSQFFLEHVYAYDDDDYPYINEVKLADMDGDGILDYVTLGHQNRTITVAYNRGFFEDPILVSFVSDEALRNLVLQDFDQDGDVDIIVSAPFDDVSYWYSNDPVAGFVRDDFPIADYNSLLFEDMDGDGDIDMVAEVNDRLNVYNFSEGSVSVRKQVDFDSFGFTYKALTTFDKNGDGLLEILTADAFDGILLFEQTAGDNFTKIELLPDVFSVEKLEVADLNGDGFFDIVASSKFNGSCKIQMNQGDDTFVEERIVPENERISIANLIDVETDGDLDIVYYDTGFGVDGGLYVYLNSDGVFTKESLDYETDTDFEDGAVGDINGDGYTDMVYGDNPFFETNLVAYSNFGVLSTKNINGFYYKIGSSLTYDVIQLSTTFKTQVRLIDQFGNVLYTDQCIGEKTISVKDLNSGIYFIQLQQGEQIATEKIVKVRL